MFDGYGELISDLRDLALIAKDAGWDKMTSLFDRVEQAATALEQAQYGVDSNLYNEEEVHENCTVQILKNTYTGKISIGWFDNTKGENDGSSNSD